VTYAPNAFDVGLISLSAVLAIIEVRLFSLLWKDPVLASNARTRAYVYLITYQWVLTACVVALWIWAKRPWSALLLGKPNLWGFAAGLALGAVYFVLVIWQRRKIYGRPELGERVRQALGSLEPILPHTRAEYRLWPYAAVTAGCCEELLFRGFLFAFAASLMGIAAAVPVTAILFGLFHAYYGLSGMLKTAAFGLVMSLLALAAHSLIPVILIHAAADLFNGDTGYRLLSRSASS